MRSRRAKNSDHSDVRILVQNGQDVSDLGITVPVEKISEKAPAKKKSERPNYKKRRGRKWTNPYAISR